MCPTCAGTVLQAKSCEYFFDFFEFLTNRQLRRQPNEGRILYIYIHTELVWLEGRGKGGKEGKEGKEDSSKRLFTHPKCLSQGQVWEEDVCLLDVADLSLHLATHPPPVQHDTPTG